MLHSGAGDTKMKIISLWLLSLLLSPLAYAQDTRTKVGAYYLGETFEQAFPTSYEQKFLDYLKSDEGASVMSFIALQRGSQNERLVFDDDPDDNTTLHKVLSFQNRRLVSIVYSFDKNTSFESQLRLLTAKYGKPTHLATETMQNGFGARWNCRQAFWELKNGDSITAFENVQDAALQVAVGFDLKGTIKTSPSKSPY
jgi:hypothetical protein